MDNPIRTMPAEFLSLKAIPKPNQTISRSRWLRLAVVLVIIVCCLGAMALPPVRKAVQSWFAGQVEGRADKNVPAKAPELIEAAGQYGLRVNQEAIDVMKIQTVPVIPAVAPQPLPPQPGQVNYDIEHLFVIRPRFPGEVVEFGKVVDTAGPSVPTRYRRIRFGDLVKQGDLLFVVSSAQFGSAKTDLVDAMNALGQSKPAFERQIELSQKGASTPAAFDAAERQYKADLSAYTKAEMTLKTYKLSNEELEKIKEEARTVLQQKKRSASQDATWARVEHRVPKLEDPTKQLAVVELNVTQNEMVDPARDTPAMRLADLSRLAVWVYPPLEYLPIIREQQQRGNGSVKWQIQFADQPNTPPLELEIRQTSQSLDPNQQRPMLIGSLPNPDSKYFIGQPLTATIFLPPEPDTVEIPTDALNQMEGQNLVFVAGANKNEFFLKRVAVVKSFQKVSYVRSKLTPEDEAFSKAEISKGRRPLQTLLPGDKVITRHVLELTAALDEALSTKK
jgi:hypothetical protein